jgi:hypothetical protein
MRRLAAAVLFVLLGLATGCANTGSGSAGGPSGPSSPPTPTSSTATTPAPGPTESGSITVDGIVERGVEPGCLVLRTGSKSYLLLRSDGGEAAENVPVAVPIRVQGDVITGIASYCQQGTPLLVRTVTRR